MEVSTFVFVILLDETFLDLLTSKKEMSNTNILLTLHSCKIYTAERDEVHKNNLRSQKWREIAKIQCIQSGNSEMTHHYEKNTNFLNGHETVSVKVVLLPLG